MTAPTRVRFESLLALDLVERSIFDVDFGVAIRTVSIAYPFDLSHNDIIAGPYRGDPRTSIHHRLTHL